jgi:hypothetical protein
MSPITAPASEILSSIYGAYRLALGDKKGLDYLNISYVGFWQSFTAAMLIIPPFMLLLCLRYFVNDSDVNLLRFFSVHSIAYIIGWVAFPLLIFYLNNIFNNGQRYIRYIVAYNWASVLQNFFYLPFVILIEANLLQGNITTVIGLFLLGLMLIYNWYITKTALELSNSFACTLVCIDFTLSILLNSIIQRMLHTI